MNLIEEAYNNLYPDRKNTRDPVIQYSGRFSDYNANIKMTPSRIIVSMSKKWRRIDKEIKIGLIQELLCKIFKSRKSTINMELYHNFIKNLDLVGDKREADPELLKSFDRVNNIFFFNAMEYPNLRWGNYNFRVLGVYDYQTDTITISSSLRKAPLEVLDYVMYHEMLHKKFKYKYKNGKSCYHTPEFRRWEKKYPCWNEVEQKLKRISKRSVC